MTGLEIGARGRGDPKPAAPASPSAAIPLSRLLNGGGKAPASPAPVRLFLGRGAGGDGWRRARRSGGFTLVEVLVAFVILALTLSATYAALSGALRWEARAGETAAAVLTARSWLDEAGRARALAEGTVEETLPTGQQVAMTMHRVEPFAVTGPTAVEAWQVEVRVVGPDGAAVTLRELKLAPR